MRSELVTQAEGPVRNRYLLVQVASRLTRGFHRFGTRVPETINDSLRGLASGKYFVWPDRTISGLTTEDQMRAARLGILWDEKFEPATDPAQLVELVETA